MYSEHDADLRDGMRFSCGNDGAALRYVTACGWIIEI
jgi:hypothetical protein